MSGIDSFLTSELEAIPTLFRNAIVKQVMEFRNKFTVCQKIKILQD